MQSGKPARGLFTLAVILSLVPSCLAEELAAENSETPSQVIQKDLRPIRMLIKNINVKIKRGVAGMDRTEPGEVPAVTGWAAACCTPNVVSIRKRTASLEQSAADLLGLYRKAGRQEGIRISESLVSEVKTLRATLELFAAAPNRTSTDVALQNLIREVLHVDKRRQELESCCNDLAVPLPRQPQDG